MNREGVLVVVESEAKASTIQPCLPNGYSVFATDGRLIDLPRSRMGITNMENFEPEYLTVRGRAARLRDLLRRAKGCALVLTAGDNDREGEAYCSSIAKSIHAKYPELSVKRIACSELTAGAIARALESPSEIDAARVEAQKARRVLDRLVGYNLSPILWRKVKNGLSAGRVQSPALHLICEREKEVQSFVPREYWGLRACLKSGRIRFEAVLCTPQGNEAAFDSEKEITALINKIECESFTVSTVRESENAEEAPAPFITSTLQQCAADRFGFSSKKTMRLARELYEGLELRAEDGSLRRLGLISYMRSETDSVPVEAVDRARAFIGREFPAELPGNAAPQGSRTVQPAAESEAIIPCDVELRPESVKNALSRDLYQLYALVWERFVASQMSPAKRHIRIMTISAAGSDFTAMASRLVEEGFYKALRLTMPKNRRGENAAPELQPGSVVKLDSLGKERHICTGPQRYSDASIVRALDEYGVGRASTYAPTVSVLLDRYYIVRNEGQLVPTELGTLIDGILAEYFPEIVDVGFSARMEKKLDSIEAGQLDWRSDIAAFYGPFKARVDSIMRNLEPKRGFLVESTGAVCEKCGRPMVKKLGRFGFFLACSGFPECKNTRSIPLAKCPLCGTGQIVARRKSGTRGREFYGCTNYPSCQFISYYKPTDSVCPSCGWFLVEKNDRKHGFYKACINPSCGYLHLPDDESSQGARRSAS